MGLFLGGAEAPTAPTITKKVDLVFPIKQVAFTAVTGLALLAFTGAANASAEPNNAQNVVYASSGCNTHGGIVECPPGPGPKPM